VPDWVGIRIRPDGLLYCKPYHRVIDLDERFHLPPGLPSTLHPVMASLDPERDTVELYLRRSDPCTWAAFVDRCTAALPASRPVFSPHPRPAPESFCVSLQWQRGRLSAISVFADERALPADADIRAQWTAGLESDDRESYEAAFGAVRSLGRRPPRGWHGMLSWTVDAAGAWHRAASLRVPRLR
jgi:hypothetical protein